MIHASPTDISLLIMLPAKATALPPGVPSWSCMVQGTIAGDIKTDRDLPSLLKSPTGWHTLMSTSTTKRGCTRSSPSTFRKNGSNSSIILTCALPARRAQILWPLCPQIRSFSAGPKLGLGIRLRRQVNPHNADGRLRGTDRARELVALPFVRSHLTTLAILFLTR